MSNRIFDLRNEQVHRNEPIAFETRLKATSEDTFSSHRNKRISEDKKIEIAKANSMFVSYRSASRF